MTTVLGLVTEELPGMTFTQLVAAARNQGISKPALWRHLTKFVELGLVLHEGKSYRRNPLHGLVVESKVSVGMRAETEHPRIRLTWPPGPRRSIHDFRFLRQDRYTDLWSPRHAAPAEPESKTVADSQELYFSFAFAVSLALRHYLSLLAILCDVESLATARELANILMDSEVARPLMELARDIWEHRNEVSLDSLGGRELKFSIMESETQKSRVHQDGAD